MWPRASAAWQTSGPRVSRDTLAARRRRSDGIRSRKILRAAVHPAVVRPVVRSSQAAPANHRAVRHQVPANRLAAQRPDPANRAAAVAVAEAAAAAEQAAATAATTITATHHLRAIHPTTCSASTRDCTSEMARQEWIWVEGKG